MLVVLPEALLRAHTCPQVPIIWLHLQGQASLKPPQLPVPEWSPVEMQMSELESLAGSDKDVSE